MSKMGAEIGRIVAEDVSLRVTQYDVLYEAITNALHANSTKITCRLYSDQVLQSPDGNELATRKVSDIVIEDNGDGFGKENFESFSKYRSAFKIKLGCKGVGRFIFLKVYQQVWYKSAIKNIGKERTFIFDLNFDTDNIKESDLKVEENRTEVRFATLTPHYLDHSKMVDRRISLELNAIR
jgi:hypothetical protein